MAPAVRRLRFDGSLVTVLARVQRGRGDPCMRLWDRGCWRATRTPDGPATLSLTRVGDAVESEAWGAGAAWALEHLPDLLGLHDVTLPAFDPPQGLIRELARGACLRIGRTLAVAEALVPTVLEQRVTGGAARRSWRDLVRRVGSPAPGPLRDLRLPPEPAVLAATPSWVFHRAGVERSRAETITGAMRQAMRIEEITSMSIDDAHRRLRSFRGVGVWTANEVALNALGDPDAVSVGDFHLKHLVSYALAGEPRGTDERMLELLAPYRGHRARAVRLLEDAGIRSPRFGPRIAVPEIAAL